MRHQKSGKKLSRTSAHRKAMWSNMVTSLLVHERIETTETKAKELRRFAEPTISWALSVGDLTAKGDKASTDEKAQIVHAMRMARRVVKDREALSKLFSDIAPRFKGRSGGFTRILKTRVRRGDAVQMAFVELVVRNAAEAAPEAKEAAPEEPKKKPAKAAKKAKSADKSAE
jgi:large subunit ribosomal protein L17